jgi:ABC-type multidrug transport system fused ATPase/permease subunit
MLNRIINIKLNNIHYQFPNTKKPVFIGLNLMLTEDVVLENNTNHLYGIIGPSGVGKTTIISILGGQLKPDQGEVVIDGHDIYNIYDKDRRELIAYQMQTATNLRGNVRTNLIFGIFNNSDQELFSDIYLTELLIKVGLWTIFEEKEGLDTLIGEGGLNLSGGQRQRLNFASLYLRAKFYNPVLVLIDEPTSSLDELSEISITNLINELATQSIVLVVAHRLVTIANAKGIIDMSTVSTTPIVPMTKSQLLLSSQYYQDLNNNKVSLDE